MARGQPFIRAAISGVDVTITAATETVARTLGGVSCDKDERVRLIGWVVLLLGTNTTAVTLRIRRGTGITGALISSADAVAIPSAAGTVGEFTIEAEDTGVEQAGASYVLTVEQTAATADGTASASGIYATASP